MLFGVSGITIILHLEEYTNMVITMTIIIVNASKVLVVGQLSGIWSKWYFVRL